MTLSRRALLAASAAWLAGCASQPERSPARVAPDPAPVESASRLPAMLDRSGLLLPLAISRYRFWATVDTGSSATVLARPVASLCERMLSPVRAYAQSGAREMSRCAVGPVELGPMRFNDVAALIDDYRDDEAVFIGLDILNRIVLDVAVEAQSATVYAPGTEPSFDGFPLPLMRRGTGLFLALEAGGERALAMLDTGHSGTISMDAAYARQRGLISRATSGAGQANVVLPRIRVGGVDLNDQPVRIVDHINFANIGCVALLGAGFLFDRARRVRFALGENMVAVAA